MTDRVLPARPETQVFIGAKGHVVIKQTEHYRDNEHVILLDVSGAEQVAKWLMEVAEERKQIPDSDYEDESDNG